MASAPLDEFSAYYTEKLWSYVPVVYRLEDGSADKPGVLRAFVELIGERFADLRRSQDRLWDDQFIDLCDEWAVPYIGDLVATRLISALNPRGRRIDVAKTIYYRRRKGTPRVLEELVDDIAGWEGKLVEEFRRLNRTRYRLDPPTPPYQGLVTHTAPGGWADLRSLRGSELAGSAFDEYCYTPDVRRARGRSGRYNIPKFALHVYRLEALALVDVWPHARAGGFTFTIDPSGRDVPLFSKRDRPPDYDQWRSASAWELPAPIKCRLLGDAAFVVTNAAIAQLQRDLGLSSAAAQQLAKLVGYRIDSQSRLHLLVSLMTNAGEILAPAVWHELLSLTLTTDCGKGALMWRSASAPGSIVVTQNSDPVPIERTNAANLVAWNATATDAIVLIDPERGRLLFPSDPPTLPVTVSVYYGSTGAPGAGTYERTALLAAGVTHHLVGGGAIPAADFAPRAVVQIDDSATYGPVSDPEQAMQTLVVQAADGHRPYVVLNQDWTLTGDAAVTASLVVDGLWLGTSAAGRIALAGTFDSVTVQRCTLDPGGADADEQTIEPVAIAIAGTVRQLTIAASIVGAITLAGGALEQLVVTDSIVQVTPETAVALALSETGAQMRRTTLLGGAQFDRLDASEVIATGAVTVTDTQDGCFRYSAAPSSSELPHAYRSVVLDDSRSLFESRRLGDPGYARLSEAAPLSIERGGEDTCEMGAFSSLHEQVRLDSLQVKVEEYMPFGLIPVYIFED